MFFILASWEDDFTPAPAWGVGRLPLRAFEFRQVEVDVFRGHPAFAPVLQQHDGGAQSHALVLGVQQFQQDGFGLLLGVFC